MRQRRIDNNGRAPYLQPVPPEMDANDADHSIGATDTDHVIDAGHVIDAKHADHTNDVKDADHVIDANVVRVGDAKAAS